ncbi:MAG: PASTA domain-containing protein [Proteobacteria bacterium]|nr:PASTA domain-containing protein [Pseudomonadota bacterium]MBQ9241985.1 PASTA domain-containing protein [Pseudomonadota bacterium]
MRVQTKRKLSVPDLEGLSAENASVYLELNGFPKPDIMYEESDVRAMTVLHQDPQKGQIVDADTIVTIYVSQSSFCDLLPGIYRTSIYEGHTHLRDYLWIFRHMFDSVSMEVDNIPKMFDPYETPARFLPWLASWIGFVLDEDWPEGKKRYLLRRALEYYRIRGTVKGLKLFLSIFVGVEPEIIENAWPFNGFQIGVHSTMDFDTIIFPVVNLSHCFIVDIPLEPEEVSEYTIVKIHDIIRAEKPAHTMYYLRFKGKKVALSEFQLLVGDEEQSYVIGSGEEIVELGETEVERLPGEE